jgi:Double zinc ribbon
MKCPRCQAANEERLKFYEECGVPLTRACPNGGAQVRPNHIPRAMP